MPKPKEDGLEIKVPAGSTVLKARERSGESCANDRGSEVICSSTLKLPTMLLLGLLACIAPAAAFGQLKPEAPTGSHIPVPPEAVTAKEAGFIAKAFARCIYENNRKAAAAVLAHSDALTVDLPAAQITDLNRTFHMPVCLGKQARETDSALGFKFGRQVLRRMLTEEDYLAGHLSAPTLAAGTVELIDRNYVSDGDNLRRAREVGTFADCVVFNDVAGSDALLRTVPASTGERAAARALVPALGKCLEQGAQLSMSPESIRVYVADGLWNRFSRPGSAQADATVKP